MKPGEPQQPQVNVEQTRAWDGVEGDLWTENEEWYNAAARYITPQLFAGAAIRPADRVLDIGCGTGATTRAAARIASSGSAFGIDLSSRMIERARERAAEEGLANVRFERGDAQVYRFDPSTFDVVISRFGSMFFDDPVQAFTNVCGALKPRGRLALVCWRDTARNEWMTKTLGALAGEREIPTPPPDAPSGVSFADPSRVRRILTAGGFEEPTLEPISEPFFLGPDAATAFEKFGKTGIAAGLLKDLDDRGRAESLERLRTEMKEHETPEGVLFDSSAWLVRATNPG